MTLALREHVLGSQQTGGRSTGTCLREGMNYEAELTILLGPLGFWIVNPNSLVELALGWQEFP